MTTEQGMHIKVEKPSINPIQALMLTGGLIVNVAAIGITYANYTRDIRDVQTKTEKLGEQVTQLSNQWQQISIIQFQQNRLSEQVSESKASISDTNRKFDKMVESFGTKLDSLVDGLNVLRADVKVLGTRLDNIPGARTRYSTPIIKP